MDFFSQITNQYLLACVLHLSVPLPYPGDSPDQSRHSPRLHGRYQLLSHAKVGKAPRDQRK